MLWEGVGTLELGKFLRGARAIEGTAGRKTLSPRMKLVLWLYAISMGVGSAREVARLVRSDDAYRWIAFDLKVGHDTLSSFRVEHGAALDELMTDILASLTHKGVLSLDLVAQDGIRIRAAATAPSFRRLPSLLECREQAALQLKAWARQGHVRRATRRDPLEPAAARGHAARIAAARQRARSLSDASSIALGLVAHGSCGAEHAHEHEYEHEYEYESDWSVAAPLVDSSSVKR